MDPSEVDSLVQRLVSNPHDEEALAYAHQAGAADPRSYAGLLERVGRETSDAAYASHWLSEAANVWSTTMGDAHHAAEVLLLAVVKDPTQDVAVERLAQLYREKGDVKGLVALLEKRAKLLAPMAAQDEQVKTKVAAMHEELGTLWAEPPLSQPTRALDNFKRAFETDPASVFAIYSARELLKQMQQYKDAVPLFALEQLLVSDPERKMALYRDEADVRRLANDLAGVTEALRNLRAYAPEDPGLIQEQASSVLERVRANDGVSAQELQEASALFVELAEMYDGEHGYSYSLAALDIEAGNDRAVQLATYYGEQMGVQADLPDVWKAYLSANPDGAMAPEIAAKLTAAGEPVPAPGSLMMPAPVVAPDAEPAVEPTAALAPPASPSIPSGSAWPEPEPHVDGRHRERQSVHPSTDISAERLGAMLEEAASYAAKRENKEALATYLEVLRHDPVSPEALAWVDEHLRGKRKFGELRDVYQAASRVPSLSSDVRRKFLLNVANICEQQLRDLEGAIQALKQASQIDASARDNLRRLLEKGQRWNDLAVLLDQEIAEAPEPESQIALLKKLAQLHEHKRKDVVAAGEAWGRLASIMTGDHGAILTAVKLFERGDRPDLAADAIAQNVVGIDGEEDRASLLMKLGKLRELTSDASGAADAYIEAAISGLGEPAWAAAERCFVASGRWEDAARAAGERAGLVEDPRKQAEMHAREAAFLLRAGDTSSAILRLEQAANLDPESDEFAADLERHYLEADRLEDLISFLLRRAGKLADNAKRVALIHRAAQMQRERLSDHDGARESLRLILADTEDADALRLLVDDARACSDFEDEASLLRRLAAVTDDLNTRADLVMRQAEVLATELEDLDAAVAAYQSILDEIDPTSVIALQAIADIEERRNNTEAVVTAIEKLLALGCEPEQRIELARRLADLYENRLGDAHGAIRALEVVCAADKEDLNAVSRLVALCERAQDWKRTAELLVVLLEFEGDPEEASALARRLATLLHERLQQGQEALAVLEAFADDGDEACRNAYVGIGDSLGFKGIVAMKLRDWYALSPSDKQHEAFRGAFARFVEMGRERDAAQTAIELIRTRGATPEIITTLEEIAVRAKNLNWLGAAHDENVRELSGQERAQEYVRQAHVLVEAGVDPVEAVQYGEQGLASISPSEVEPLLEPLAKLAGARHAVIDLYERQVGRCKNPADRLHALGRAAQAAAANNAIDRVRALFDLALGGGVRHDTLEMLEEAARVGDAVLGSTELRSALAASLSSGSCGARDGGRTRSTLLRRASAIAHRDLHDLDRAFQWLGEAIVTHVDSDGLDALERLGDEVGDLKRVETVIGTALEQVFDGPLVRQLVGRRAKLRRERLNDLTGAAEDLKRLHDLSPQDKATTEELHGLLLELRDWRNLVQLLEDQILRGKDPGIRAELARQAAQLWEERLADPRESADAWRRVLRMRPGDTEAQEGLERAKGRMLKRPLSQFPPAPSALAPDVSSGSSPAVEDNDEEGCTARPPQQTEARCAVVSPAASAAPVVGSDVKAAPVADARPRGDDEDASFRNSAAPTVAGSPSDIYQVTRQVGVTPEVGFPNNSAAKYVLAAPAKLAHSPDVNSSEDLAASDLALDAHSSPDFVGEDLVESVDNDEQAADEELLMEPAAPVFGVPSAGRKS
ncbi:MAG: hypothetical protein MUF54_04080 [Polyangiaceae bacterium]|nr:hypothetical protein [Polyangiaceae bacterium]